MTSQQVRDRIAELLPKAESGEDWAEICLLESEAKRLAEQESEDNSQFGVGA